MIANSFNSGGRYNPDANSWTPTSTTNAPGVRYSHTAVWTGDEMIIWGGAAFDNSNDATTFTQEYDIITPFRFGAGVAAHLGDLTATVNGSYADMTQLRVMMKAAENAFEELKRTGTQAALLPQMQTRRQLYELIGYADYERFDHEIAEESEP